MGRRRCPFKRAVARCVVEHEHFEIREVLRSQLTQAAAQVFAAVEVDDDDADFGMGGACQNVLAWISSSGMRDWRRYWARICMMLWWMSSMMP